VIQRARERLDQRVGRVVASQSLSLDSTETHYTLASFPTRNPQTGKLTETSELIPAWLIVYRFRILKKPWVDEWVSLTVDSSGTRMTKAGLKGIPDCRRFPERCKPDITESRAREIAMDTLQAGHRAPMTLNFDYDEYRGRFVWRIETVLRGASTSKQGEHLSLDATTGRILYRSGYALMWQRGTRAQSPRFPKE
jgi:hypothetical protein